MAIPDYESIISTSLHSDLSSEIGHLFSKSLQQGDTQQRLHHLEDDMNMFKSDMGYMLNILSGLATDPSPRLGTLETTKGSKSIAYTLDSVCKELESLRKIVGELGLDINSENELHEQEDDTTITASQLNIPLTKIPVSIDSKKMGHVVGKNRIVTRESKNLQTDNVTIGIDGNSLKIKLQDNVTINSKDGGSNPINKPLNTKPTESIATATAKERNRTKDKKVISGKYAILNESDTEHIMTFLSNEIKVQVQEAIQETIVGAGYKKQLENMVKDAVRIQRKEENDNSL